MQCAVFILAFTTTQGSPPALENESLLQDIIVQIPWKKSKEEEEKEKSVPCIFIFLLNSSHNVREW